MEPMREDWQRAVAVVAHPDDLEYGVASAVARWTRQGKEVAYVLATRGEAGIDGMTPTECAPRREDEERRSASVVGVDEVEFLGHPDGLVEPGLTLRRDIAGAVNHADHRAVGSTVLDASRDAALELGIASLREHGVYIAGLGRDFDPDEFLRNIAGFGSMVAGCEYALTLQRFGVG